MARHGFLFAALLAATLAAPASGQPLLFFQITYGGGQSGFSARYPSVDVKLFARFSPIDHALAGTWLHVRCAEPAWSENRVNPVLSTGSSPGVIQGGNVNDIVAGQVHFPPFVLANPANPILVWQAVWTTDNFTARDVPLWTETIRFEVYPSASSPMSVSRLAGLGEAHAVFLKVPSPSAAVPFGAAACVLLRRRRGARVCGRVAIVSALAFLGLFSAASLILANATHEGQAGSRVRRSGRAGIASRLGARLARR